MPSFSIPLSGLSADSTALNTIANNLSNLNTTGYKEQTTFFSSLLYDIVGSSGSGDPVQVGTGVQVAANNTNFTTGNISTTGAVYSDAAINGSGFFVLNNGSGGEVLTRDGNFHVAKDGTLESADGLAVMGYDAVNGVLNNSGAVSNIVIPVGQVMMPVATTSFSVSQNLNSGDTTAPGNVTLYDSQGNEVTANITYTNLGGNKWGYSISAPQTLTADTATAGTVQYSFGAGATVDPGTNLTITALNAAGTNTVTSGLPTFTGSPETLADYKSDLMTALGAAGMNVTGTGANQVNVNIVGSTLSITGIGSSTGSVVQDAAASGPATGTLTFNADGSLAQPNGSISGIQFSGLADGSSPLNLTWNLNSSNGAITQTNQKSGQSAENADGYPAGTINIDSMTIAADGTISAGFSNGKTQVLGQMAVGTVNNSQGLSAVGSNEYQTTSASGNISIGVAGSTGRGSIDGGELESSNVDISTEFSNLIVAQRAFEANSKSVTTFDTVTQDAISMIR